VEHLLVYFGRPSIRFRTTSLCFKGAGGMWDGSVSEAPMWLSSKESSLRKDWVPESRSLKHTLADSPHRWIGSQAAETTVETGCGSSASSVANGTPSLESASCAMSARMRSASSSGSA
jgi:hypothetical protein